MENKNRVITGPPGQPKPFDPEQIRKWAEIGDQERKQSRGGRQPLPELPQQPEDPRLTDPRGRNRWG
jgi:hypothetical protein